MPHFNRRAFIGGTIGLVTLPMAVRATDTQKSSKLVLLGTAGGPSPKPNRAAPGHAICVGDAIYIVDCGNGIARQMVLAGLKLDRIRSVFITHHHSDHNADYGNLLLLAWANNLNSSVQSYGPPPLKRMTRQFLQLNDYDIKTRMADEGRGDLGRLIKPHNISRGGLIYQDENVRVTATLVNHPPVAPAFAYRFDCPDRSIVISGDTAPTDALIALAKGADILVHEVMDVPALDALITTEPNAPRLREHLLASHTTTEQVGRIATAAGVKTLVLSHFVPGGYPFLTDEYWLQAVRPYFAGQIIVGRDLMTL